MFHFSKQNHKGADYAYPGSPPRYTQQGLSEDTTERCHFSVITRLLFPRHTGGGEPTFTSKEAKQTRETIGCYDDDDDDDDRDGVCRKQPPLRILGRSVHRHSGAN